MCPEPAGPRIRPLADRDVPELDPAVHFLGGAKATGLGDEIDVVYPATSEVLCRLKLASHEQLSEAIASARSTFDRGTWRERPAEERAKVLHRMGDLLDSWSDRLVPRIVYDNGKTLPEAMIDVRAAAGACRAAAGACLEIEEPQPPPERGVEKRIWRDPVGVVAGITPFNAPLMFAALKAAPALASGNSVVLKPSERAPLAPIALCEAAREAGLPAGALSLVHGRADIAAALCRDPRVDMISLTGGVPAGAAVMRAAAAGIKNVLLELGGKSAHIILGDADVDRAIAAAGAAIFRNAGQRCFSGSRLIVESSIADEVEAGVAALADSLVVGDPFEEATQVGAMIDEAAVSATEEFVDKALAEGLILAAGGRRPEWGAGGCGGGSFYRPTVLTGATKDSFAAREEIFGPVLTILRVEDADEAVEVANESRFGLAGGIWTRDTDRALELARRVRCGYFWINTYGAIFGDLPFGGYGQSGIGREGGRWVYQAYTELKSVMLDTTGGTTAPLF